MPNSRTYLATLSEELLQLVRFLLEKENGFAPFGAWLAPNHKIELIQLEVKKQLSTTQAVQIIEDKLHHAVQKKYLAVAVCNVAKMAFPQPDQTTHVQDLVLIRLQTRQEQVNMYLPFQKQSSGTVKFGKIMATPGDLRVF